MTWLIDLVGFMGILLVAAGVWLQFGLPWALICGGISVFGMALMAGIREANVSDS